MITKCYTISELLCWTSILMSDCEDRVCMMNNIMQDFYDYMYGSPLTKIAEWFTWNWSKVMELSHDLYKIEWFYWYGGGCANNNCFLEVPICVDCFCPKLYQIKMEPTLYDVNSSQYRVRYEWDKWFVDFNIPNWVDQWYVVYSVVHQQLNSYDDTICIDPRLLTWLKLMIKKAIAEKDNEFNVSSYYSQRLAERKEQKTKDISNNLISVTTNNVR